MGFEITYHYREEISKGEYAEEIKIKTAKVGKSHEDTPLESVAGKVMAQLARRNILIIDVEIYEYTKKKISYKEADDGILIKNKKFRFDDGAIVSSGEASEDSELETMLNDPDIYAKLTALLIGPQGKPLAPHQVARAMGQNKAADVLTPPASLAGKRVIRKEKFQPELMQAHKAKQAGLRFTEDKIYSIFGEESMGASIVYTTMDDAGKEVKVSAEYFVAPTAGKLQFANQMSDDGPAPGIDLWGKTNTVGGSDMPDIR